MQTIPVTTALRELLSVRWFYLPAANPARALELQETIRILSLRGEEHTPVRVDAEARALRTVDGSALVQWVSL